MASNISQTFSQDGSADINVGNITGTVSLPAGAATSANQATEITALSSIESTSNSTAVNTNSIMSNQTNGTQRTLITDLVGNLQPAGSSPSLTIFVKPNDGTNSITVKAASTAPAATDTAQVVALSPNGNQATAALQTTGNTSLASIDAGIPAALGSTSSANSMPVVDVIATATQYRAQSVTTTSAQALGAATVLSNRKMISITPTNGVIYWGGNSSVTTATGSPIFPNNTLFLSFTDNVPVWLIASATTDVRILEAS